MSTRPSFATGIIKGYLYSSIDAMRLCIVVEVHLLDIVMTNIVLIPHPLPLPKESF
jgi:hypothetical protein